MDEWIKDPQHLIPENTMPFPGLKNADDRADLLAFLKDATNSSERQAANEQQGRTGGMMGGMGGMMGGGTAPNLKRLSPDQHVQKLSHCGDTYTVATEDGKSRAFWERNLRFKTDSSEMGPQAGTAAIVGAGMIGDRADVIFASPQEISTLIAEAC